MLFFGKHFIKLFYLSIDYENSKINFIMRDSMKENVKIDYLTFPESRTVFFIAIGIIIFLVLLLIGFILSYFHQKNIDKRIMEEAAASGVEDVNGEKILRLGMKDHLRQVSIDEGEGFAPGLQEEDSVV